MDILATVKRLLDAGDTIAAMDLLWLFQPTTPEEREEWAWLQDRLTYTLRD